MAHIETVKLSVRQDGTPWYAQDMPLAEAVKRIHTLGRKRTVFLAVNHKAPDATKEDSYWPVYGTVKVNRAVAEAFVKSAYEHFDKRGALVHLSWCDTCLFVG